MIELARSPPQAAGPPTRDRAHGLEEVNEIFLDRDLVQKPLPGDPLPGEMRVTAELRYGRKITLGHNAGGSIMREIGLKELPTRGRVFARKAPNQLWTPSRAAWSAGRSTSTQTVVLVTNALGMAANGRDRADSWRSQRSRRAVHLVGNTRRRHSTLGMLSLSEYEELHNSTREAA